jgi:hypothetical protein
MTAAAAAADETAFQLRGQLVGALCERDSARRSLAATSADLTAAQQQLSTALIQYKRLCAYAKSLHADAQATLEQQTCAEAACAALRREADDERVLRAYVQAERDATRDQLVEARAQTAAAEAEVRRLQEAERAATMRSEQWSAALQHRTDELRASELRCGASERAASSSEHERQRLAALLVMNTKEVSARWRTDTQLSFLNQD